jgi:hypothetical protein
MPIQFTCSCGSRLQAAEEHAGRRIKCPDCGAEMTVPPAEGAVQTAEPTPPKPSPVQAEAPRPPAEDERDEDRPRRRARPRDDEDDEDDDRPRRRAAAETSGKASAALVLGLLSFCLGILTAIPAIILAILSLNEISRSRGRLGGKGLAIAGLICACLGTVLLVLLVLPVLLLVPAVSEVREATTRIQSSNNLMQITLATINEADRNNGLMPARAICDRNGKPLLSWRVALLPHLEQDALYRQFKLDEPWDGPNNSRLIPLMPKAYAHPTDPDAAAKGLTYYRAFTGPHTAFPDPLPPFPQGRSPCRFPGSFVDGTSNTILFVEAGEAVPWTKPDELRYDPNEPLPKLGGHFRSGYWVGMADGSVKFLTPQLSERTLRNAITIDDGNMLGPDWPGN